jgi:hypothetical protein
MLSLKYKVEFLISCYDCAHFMYFLMHFAVHTTNDAFNQYYDSKNLFIFVYIQSILLQHGRYAHKKPLL